MSPRRQSSPPHSPTSSQSSTTTPGSASAAQRARELDVLKPPTKDDLLRGAYGPYRANNDLLFYALKLRVDPDTKTIKGSNTIRFRMLADGTRIQIDLSPDLTIDSITFNGKPLHYERVPDTRALYLDFPETLRKGKTYEVVFAYSGHPVTQGRFGCFSFDKDKEGKPWITTACEGEGPSIWWPNKDQWKDEPQDGMELDIAVPNGLMDVSNGRFEGSKDLGDGYTEWRWHVHYPINNYDVALNIGEYSALHHAAAWQDHARLLRPSRRPRQSEGAVRAGPDDARRLREIPRRISLRQRRLQAHRSPLRRHGAPVRRRLRQPLHQRLSTAATGPASASA